MRALIQILFFWLCLGHVAQAFPDEALVKVEILIDDSNDLPVDEMVEALRGSLCGLGELGDIAGVNRRTQRDQEVYERVQALLISKPGHAEYIEKKIREVMETHKKLSREGACGTLVCSFAHPSSKC